MSFGEIPDILVYIDDFRIFISVCSFEVSSLSRVTPSYFTFHDTLIADPKSIKNVSSISFLLRLKGIATDLLSFMKCIALHLVAFMKSIALCSFRHFLGYMRARLVRP